MATSDDVQAHDFEGSEHTPASQSSDTATGTSNPLPAARAVNVGEIAIDATKGVLVGVVGMIPGIGDWVGLGLGLLLDQLFPSGAQDVWEDIKEKVEKLVDQKIADAHMATVRAYLQGIERVFGLYVRFAQLDDDPGEIKRHWDNCFDDIELAIPEFRRKEYQLPLLPLFVQLVNLQLILFHDMSRYGVSKWKLKPSTVEEYKKILGGYVDSGSNPEKNFRAYVRKVYNEGLGKYSLSDPGTGAITRNAWEYITYQREMGLAALEYANVIWPCYDPGKYPQPVTIKRDWEFFVGPLGWDTAETLGHYQPPGQQRQMLTGLTVWSWHRMDAIRASYGGVPGPRQGSTGGAVAGDWSFDKDRYIDKIWVRAAARHVDNSSTYGVYKFAIGTNDGWESPWCGQGIPTNTKYQYNLDGFRIENYRVSSITVTGANHSNDAAKCMMVGFRHNSTTYDSPITLEDTYTIASADVDGLWIAIAKYSNADNLPVEAWSAPKDTSWQWKITDAGSKGIRLHNLYSGRCLASDPPSGSAPKEAYQYRPELRNDTFFLSKNDDGSYKLLSEVNSGWGIGLLLSQQYVGGRIIVGRIDDTSTASYRWHLHKVNGSARERAAKLLPSLSWAIGSGQQDVGYFKANAVLQNSSRIPLDNGWLLSFELPSGLDVRIDEGDGDGAQLVSTRVTDRGVEVVVKATAQSGKKALAPGDSFRFSVYGSPADPREDIRDMLITPGNCILNSNHIAVRSADSGISQRYL